METTDQLSNFDDIRPFLDSEVPEAIEQLLADEKFRKAVEPLVQPFSWEKFSAAMRSCKTVDNFQRNIIYPTVNRLIEKTTKELKGINWDNAENGASHLIISNHRDIVLDAAFLNMIMFAKMMDTTEIAIGDNLLIYPWITTLVRLNRSFIVKRSVSMREMLQTSKHLSDYIHHTVTQRDQSIWIAQREGRAKDSSDRTQTSLLKMLTLHNSSKPVETLQELNIIPLAISYELDPCASLKAKGSHQNRANPEYKNTPADDLENMLTGINGYKGRVHFTFGNEISDRLKEVEGTKDKAAMLEFVAKTIDDEIYGNYAFFPFNYVAYDLMTDSQQFQSEYTGSDKLQFEQYVKGQIEKINIPDKDPVFLREKIIEMYGNTVKNQLSVSSLTAL